MSKQKQNAIAKAKAQVATQTAHVERMIAAGQPEIVVRAAKRLVFVYEMKVAHLEQGGTEKSFDLFDGAKLALAAYPFIGKAAR